LSILWYLRCDSKSPVAGHDSRKWYWLSLLAFLFALLAKTSVVMLPFVLLLCAWWQTGRISLRDALRSAPFFLLALALGLVTLWFQSHRAIGEDIVRTDSFPSRLAGAGLAVWFYIYKALLPVNLAFVYPRWEINPHSALSFVPLLMLLAGLALCWKFRARWGRAWLFGIGYFVLMLLPVLGFFNVYFQRYSLVADHWQYLSIVGVIALAVGIGRSLLMKQDARTKPAQREAGIWRGRLAGMSNWTASATLVPGTNTFNVKSKDLAGNESAVASRKVFLSVAGVYTLVTNGTGSVTGALVPGDAANPGVSGAALKIGRRYTVRAAAGANYLFSNWLASVNGGATAVVGSSSTYSFTMASNEVLTAQFVTNRFIGAAGRYDGLFMDTGVSHQSSGFISVKTTSKQVFSGTIRLQGEVIAIAGTFDQAGHGTLKPLLSPKFYSRKGMTNNPINLTLDIDLNGGDSLTGTMTSGEGWRAGISADKVTWNLTNNPATNHMGADVKGHFTMVYPGSATPATEPGGDAYETVLLKTNGLITTTGFGSDFTKSAMKSVPTYISKTGAWPFYAPMYFYARADGGNPPQLGGIVKSYHGSLIGWLYVTNNSVYGDLVWSKVGWTNGYYDGGFTNMQTIVGSGYIKPASPTLIFDVVNGGLGDTNGTYTIQDGNLPATLTGGWILNSLNKLIVTGTNPAYVRLGGFTLGVGVANGSVFTNGATAPALTKGKAVVLQNINQVRGMFLGTNQSGSIRLIP